MQVIDYVALPLMGLSLALLVGCSRDPGRYCNDKANHGWGMWEDAGGSGHIASVVQVRYCTNCNAASTRWVQQEKPVNH